MGMMSERIANLMTVFDCGLIDRETFSKKLKEFQDRISHGREDIKQLNNLMDAIAEKCSWHKADSQCTAREIDCRERYKNYLRRSAIIEQQLGL